MGHKEVFKLSESDFYKLLLRLKADYDQENLRGRFATVYDKERGESLE